MSISKFINKVINRYFFFVNEHLKTGPSTKILSANNFVNKDWALVLSIER